MLRSHREVTGQTQRLQVAHRGHTLTVPNMQAPRNTY